jgi:hypothetical protein
VEHSFHPGEDAILDQCATHLLFRTAHTEKREIEISGKIFA